MFQASNIAAHSFQWLNASVRFCLQSEGLCRKVSLRLRSPNFGPYQAASVANS